MGISGKSVQTTALPVVCGLALCGLAACTSVPPQETAARNPYSPRHGHAYRHGVVPTREMMERMHQWEDAQRVFRPASGLPTDELTYGGGIDGVGVTSGVPRVYLVFYGNQWAQDGGGDPMNASMFLQAFFTGIGSAGEQWSGTMTQYCDGPALRAGSPSCNTATNPHVGYPGRGALAGVWFDTSGAAPSNATTDQLAQEAVNAAAHFGNTTPEANRYAQYLIVSPSGTHPDGFNTSGASFCGWHNYVSSAYGDLAYSNLPYVSDAGSSCGVNFVNQGSMGALDGFSIVGGHEYAETLTDQNPPGGWTNPDTGDESGDECAWIKSGEGAAKNVSLATGAFAMQSIWSNDTIRCEISHKVL
jgi:serine protease